MLQNAVEILEGLFKEYQDTQMEGLTDKLVQLDARFADVAVQLDEGFYPRLFTAVASRRWLLSSGMKLFLAKCLNSPEYCASLKNLLSYAIRKGMQSGLEAGVEHGREGRQLADLAANDPSAGADCGRI